MDAGAVLNTIPDWVTILLIAAGAWQLVPRPIRNSVGIGPALVAFLDWLKPVARSVGSAVEAGAYRVIVGRSRVNHSAPAYVPPRPMPAPVPEMRGNYSSQAQELPRNPPVPEVAELVPANRELPIKLDDLLTELALLSYVDRDGEVRQFSATRIADFIGGRRADTLEAVRVARGEPPPDGLRVKDGAGERVIAREAA